MTASLAALCSAERTEPAQSRGAAGAGVFRQGKVPKVCGCWRSQNVPLSFSLGSLSRICFLLGGTSPLPSPLRRLLDLAFALLPHCASQEAVSVMTYQCPEIL